MHSEWRLVLAIRAAQGSITPLFNLPDPVVRLSSDPQCSLGRLAHYQHPEFGPSALLQYFFCLSIVSSHLSVARPCLQPLAFSKENAGTSKILLLSLLKSYFSIDWCHFLGIFYLLHPESILWSNELDHVATWSPPPPWFCSCVLTSTGWKGSAYRPSCTPPSAFCLSLTSHW